MEKSENYNFNLPNSENDEIADINLISENFSKIDSEFSKIDYKVSKIDSELSEIDSELFEIDSELSEMIKGKGVDQSYSPTSKNPQSGTAVAGAISNLVSLEDNTEWIFDGGDASGSVEIDLVIDGEMSDTSNNPVSNKVIKKYVDNMVDLIYPVGSIYMSANDTSPSILFGGEWERIKDRFLLAAGNKYSVGSTGGEAEHKLTVDEMPSHNHGSKSLVGYMWNIASQSDTHNLAANGIVSTAMVETHGYAMHSTPEVADGFKIDATHTHNSVGGGKSHNNMPPYLAVYMWQRIS